MAYPLFPTALLLGSLLSPFGPKHVKEIGIQQLKDYIYGPEGYYSSMLSGVFYVGSDDCFDYLVVRYRRGREKKFKIKLNALMIQNRVQLGTDENKWASITSLFPFPPAESK